MTYPVADRKRSPLLPIVLAGVAVALLLVTFALRAEPAFHGTAWDPPGETSDFRLVDHRGNPAKLSDHRGKTVLLFFGFVNCPDVCPLTLTRLASAIDEIGADTARVRVLLVTVDPERDTPEALSAYVNRFGDHVIGLTGDPAALANVRTSFHAHAARQQSAEVAPPVTDRHLHAHADELPDAPDGAGARSVEASTSYSHTTQVFGIDREGRIRVLISPEFAPETIRADIRTLMRM